MIHLLYETKFDWDENKKYQNQAKHHVSFEHAQYASVMSRIIIAEDLEHSQDEKRYFCIGKVEG